MPSRATTSDRSVIDFSPSLPDKEASFIAEIDLCAVAKTLIQYDERIWRRQGRTGGFRLLQAGWRPGDRAFLLGRCTNNGWRGSARLR